MQKGGNFEKSRRRRDFSQNLGVIYVNLGFIYEYSYLQTELYYPGIGRVFMYGLCVYTRKNSPIHVFNEPQNPSERVSGGVQQRKMTALILTFD